MYTVEGHYILYVSHTEYVMQYNSALYTTPHTAQETRPPGLMFREAEWGVVVTLAQRHWSLELWLLYMGDQLIDLVYNSVD